MIQLLQPCIIITGQKKSYFGHLLKFMAIYIKEKKKDMMLRMDIREITSFKGWIALKFKKKKKEKNKKPNKIKL